MNKSQRGKLNWAKRQLKSIEWDLTVVGELFAKDPTSDVFLFALTKHGISYQRQLEVIASLEKV